MHFIHNCLNGEKEMKENKNQSYLSETHEWNLLNFDKNKYFKQQKNLMKRQIESRNINIYM